MFSSNGSMIAINVIEVENGIARNMYERSELDDLIYNDPLAYAALILNGDPEVYLNEITECKPFENWITDSEVCPKGRPPFSVCNLT